MDDAWLYDTNPVLTYYAPYDAFCPAKQVTLLQLYNELGLPHVKLKQVYGWALEIISLYMDPFIMTISMSEELQDKLTAAICAFINISESRCQPLIEWQQILRWINWDLNAFPLLWPAMQCAYAKIASKHIA